MPFAFPSMERFLFWFSGVAGPKARRAQEVLLPPISPTNSPDEPFRKREGTRASLFASIDQPMLQPLPAQPYITADWKTVRASIDYHVEVDRHFYSVPYQLAGQQMEARFTSHTVEIFEGGKRVASHMRSFAPYLHTTTKEHMPCQRAIRLISNGRRRG